MLYLVNGFSTGMLGKKSCIWGTKICMEFETLRPRDAGKLLKENDFISCFGHVDTAWHLSRYLQVNIPVNRNSIVPGPDDLILVASVRRRRDYRSEKLRCPKWSFYLVRQIKP